MTTCLAELGVTSCDRCRGEDILTRAGDTRAVGELCPHLNACATCGGSGYVRGRDADGYEFMRACGRAGIALRVARFNDAALPARFHDARLSGYEAAATPGNNQKAMRGLVEGLRDRLIDAQRSDGSIEPGVRGLGLAGSPGVGKTHLLCALTRELTIDFGMAVRYADFSGLLWDLKARFESGAGEAALLGPLIDADVLVLDEVGKGKASEWDISIVDALVTGRYNRRKTIVFATNYAFAGDTGSTDLNRAALASRSGGGPVAESLRDRVHDRVFSRLAEMCDWVTLVGPDARRSPAASGNARGNR